jgi:hypothetical protein
MTKPKPDKQERITAKLRTAIDRMVFGDENGNPLDWDDAGRSVQIPARSMRRALERPYVRQYLMQQRQVLRAALSSKNLLRLDALADQKVNLGAAVKAAQIIEAVSDEALTTRPMVGAPGVVIRIVAAGDTSVGVAPRALIPAPGPSAPVVDATDFGDDVIAVPFVGPTIGERPPAPDPSDPMRLLPPAPLRRRW